MVAEKTAAASAIAPAVAQLRGELMTLLAKIEDEDISKNAFSFFLSTDRMIRAVAAGMVVSCYLHK